MSADVRDLPEFSDDLACCQVCGWADALTKYMPGVERHVSERRDCEGKRWPLGAFLRRTCGRCGFQWGEQLIDRDRLPEDAFCDVLSTGGDRCNQRPGHFSQRSPHKFG